MSEQNEMEKTYTYIDSEGNHVDVKSINNFHLLNSLIKNVKEQMLQASPMHETNIKILRDEILSRLAPKLE